MEVMTIDRIIRIFGKGTVLIGQISCDKVQRGDLIEIKNAEGSLVQTEYVMDGKTRHLRVIAIARFNQMMEEACKGSEVAILVWGASQEIQPGMKIVKV